MYTCTSFPDPLLSRYKSEKEKAGEEGLVQKGSMGCSMTLSMAYGEW